MSNQTHINVLVQDFEDSYQEALKAVSALKEKADTLKARFEHTISELAPTVQAQSTAIASEVQSDVNAVATHVTDDVKADTSTVQSDAAAQDNAKSSDTSKSKSSK